MTGRLTPSAARPLATDRLMSCRTQGAMGSPPLSFAMSLSRRVLARENPDGAVLPGLNTNRELENYDSPLMISKACGLSGTMCLR